MMRKHLWIILLSFLLTNCVNNADSDTDNQPHLANQSFISCNGLDADTSVAGIKLGDTQSFLKIVGQRNKFSEGETYHFASKKGYQELRLIAHPGNSKESIYEFEIVNTRITGSKQKKLILDSFVTGKGIYLGMPKEKLIQIMGKCYTNDSLTKTEIIRYTVTEPHDTKNQLLRRLNYPVYYAEYKLNDEGYVNRIRFGLEYP